MDESEAVSLKASMPGTRRAYENERTVYAYFIQ
jgi:hypothetical protein